MNENELWHLVFVLWRNPNDQNFAHYTDLFYVHPSVLLLLLVASKNRRKEPGHSGYFSPVLRKMYITLIFISETTINIYLFFVHIVAFPMIQLYLKTVQYKARY